MCVDDENAISKKPPQHKLGVAFSYLERNKLQFYAADFLGYENFFADFLWQ